MIEISLSDMVFVKDVADELEATFSDMSGRPTEDVPGSFKAACFQASYEINAKFGTHQFAVYSYLRSRILENPQHEVVEEFNSLHKVFIMAIKIAGDRFQKTLIETRQTRNAS